MGNNISPPFRLFDCGGHFYPRGWPPTYKLMPTEAEKEHSMKNSILALVIVIAMFSLTGCAEVLCTPMAIASTANYSPMPVKLGTLIYCAAANAVSTPSAEENTPDLSAYDAAVKQMAAEKAAAAAAEAGKDVVAAAEAGKDVKPAIEAGKDVKPIVVAR